MSRAREEEFCENGKNRERKRKKRNCFEIKVIREKAIISVFTRETMVESEERGNPRRAKK